MENLTHTKFSDTREPLELKQTAFLLYGNINDGWETIADRIIESTHPSFLTGVERRFWGVPTMGKFVPGQFRIAPAVHQSVTAHASAAEAYFYLAKFVKPSNIVYVLKSKQSGNLAQQFQGSMSPGFAVPDIPTVEISQNVLRDALVQAKQSEYALATSLAELPETIDLFNPPTDALKKWMRKMRPPKTLRRLGTIADYAAAAWLQYRYAIMPLCYEVDDIRKLYTTKSQIERVLSKGYGVVSQDPVSNSLDFEGRRSRAVNGYYARGRDTINSTERLVSTAYATKSMSMQARMGVDVGSIPKALWELVPYSFVVDWFVDVGGWMEAAIPSPFTQTLGQTLSVKKDTIYTCQINGMTYGNALPNADNPEAKVYARYNLHQTAYRRILAGYNNSIPSIVQGVDTIKRALDSTALSYQRMLGAMKRKR